MRVREKIMDVRLMGLDKSGEIAKTKQIGDTIRLSVFVTSPADTHHIEFQDGVERCTSSNLLHELADRVAKGT